MFTAKIWKHTGYNGINIPDSADTLERLPYTEYPALDILADIALDRVKLHGTQSDFEDIDYIKVGNEYYKVFDSPIPLNGDTWEIPLVYDAVTSIGINNIKFLDGITTRASVGEDEYGEYCLEDELLTPSEPLQLEVNPISIDNKIYKNEQGNILQNPEWAEQTLVETTIDLGLMACIDGSVVYTDEDGKEVIVPHSYPKMGRHTQFFIGLLPGVDTKTTVYPVPGNDSGKSVVHEGIQKCRALGIESAIFNQVSIPAAFSTAVTEEQIVGKDNTTGTTFCDFEDPTHPGVLQTREDIGVYNGFAGDSDTLDYPGKTITKYLFIREMTGITSEVETGFDFIYNTDIKNKRVLYGKNNTVGMLTTAGNRLESAPEELTGGDHTAPRIVYKGDPHLTGAPYYRFEYMNKMDSSGEKFFYNAIKGLTWKKVPLIFTETSGSALNTIAFENSRRIADYNFESSISGLVTRGVGKVGEAIDYAQNELGSLGFGSAVAAGSVGGILGAGYGLWAGGGMTAAGALTAAGTGVLGGVASAGLAIGGYKVYTDYRKYENQKIAEISALAAKNQVSSPTVAVSYDAEAFRDFYGEILFAYRYRPSDRDLSRMDKLLTMYGYRVSMPIQDISLTSREKFNYLEAEVSVGGDIPMWKKDAIRAQLSAGVRIWHKKPDPADYNTGNPIRS